jgi:hypothetical protein
MHGVILAALQKLAEATFGGKAGGAWSPQAPLGPKTSWATQDSPDREVVALGPAAATLTGTPAGVLLAAFGAFRVPDVRRRFQMSITPQWRTLDVLEPTKQTIHKAVRLKTPGANPPALVGRRTSPEEVVIQAASPRKLCPVANGIGRGVAKHDQEPSVLTEPRGMVTGSPSCTIVVRRQTSGGERSLMSRTLGGAFLPTACPNPALPSRRGHPLSLCNLVRMAVVTHSC